MGWKIDHNIVNNIIELEYSGRVSAEDLKNAFNAAVSCILEYKTGLILSDCTKMRAGHTLFDLLGLVENVESIDSLRNIKEAVLLIPGQESAANISFWETACRNRGFNVKIFEDWDEAVKWLIKI